MSLERLKGTCPDCGTPTARGGRCGPHKAERARVRSAEYQRAITVVRRRPRKIVFCSECGEETRNAAARCPICAALHRAATGGRKSDGMVSEGIALRVAMAAEMELTPEQIDDRDYSVDHIIEVMGGPMTLAEIGAVTGTSYERARQTMESALRKLRGSPYRREFVALMADHVSDVDRESVWDALGREAIGGDL